MHQPVYRRRVAIVHGCRSEPDCAFAKRNSRRCIHRWQCPMRLVEVINRAEIRYLSVQLRIGSTSTWFQAHWGRAPQKCRTDRSKSIACEADSTARPSQTTRSLATYDPVEVLYKLLLAYRTDVRGRLIRKPPQTQTEHCRNDRAPSSAPIRMTFTRGWAGSDVRPLSLLLAETRIRPGLCRSTAEPYASYYFIAREYCDLLVDGSAARADCRVRPCVLASIGVPA